MSLTSIHGTRRNGVDADQARLQLLGHAARKVLDGRLGAGVRGVEAGKGGEKGRDNGDELAAVRDVLGAGLEDEEGSLGVDARQMLAFISIRETGKKSKLPL